MFSLFRVVKDCTYVIHTASPFPSTAPSNPDEVLKPAVDGTKNVLKACSEAGTVKRVVLTSSIAAVHGKDLFYFPPSYMLCIVLA